MTMPLLEEAEAELSDLFDADTGTNQLVCGGGLSDLARSGFGPADRGESFRCRLRQEGALLHAGAEGGLC
jgi:hypothetical protein